LKKNNIGESSLEVEMIYEMASFKPEEKVRKNSCLQKKRLHMLEGVKR